MSCPMCCTNVESQASWLHWLNQTGESKATRTFHRTGLCDDDVPSVCTWTSKGFSSQRLKKGSRIKQTPKQMMLNACGPWHRVTLIDQEPAWSLVRALFPGGHPLPKWVPSGPIVCLTSFFPRHLLIWQKFQAATLRLTRNPQLHWRVPRHAPHAQAAVELQELRQALGRTYGPHAPANARARHRHGTGTTPLGVHRAAHGARCVLVYTGPTLVSTTLLACMSKAPATSVN